LQRERGGGGEREREEKTQKGDNKKTKLNFKSLNYYVK